mmetsp:Transcript_58848/g.97366  ORF Transcript_58848/g.97366 Transcript_58848/m.97366 type:complete len:82 (-) Transcript_58848:8-253(-)
MTIPPPTPHNAPHKPPSKPHKAIFHGLALKPKFLYASDNLGLNVREWCVRVVLAVFVVVLLQNVRAMNAERIRLHLMNRTA